jgi:large subunit ribosomal protein L13
MKIYIDATEMQLGRLGSFVVKKALLGDEIVVLNSEKAIISGNKADILGGITNLRNKGGNSLKGPKVPRSPERLLKRMIRGMLPWDRQRGRDAFKRIKCYQTGEFDLTNIEITKIENKLPKKYMVLKEVSRLI